MTPIDLLAIAAHPDDVELSCAGTMLMAKRSGKRTGIVDLTQGELSTRGTLVTRAKETDAASEIMKLDYRTNLRMPDGNIELSQTNLMKLVAELRKTKATILLTPHTHERHPDHEAASELAHRAVFYAGLAKIEMSDENGKPLEPHRPLLTLQYMQTWTFEPKIILDITPVVTDRMRAVEAFESQFARAKNTSSRIGTAHELPADRKEPETFLTQSSFYDWIKSRASAYGMIIGTEYGEPFWCHQPLGTDDPFHLVTKRFA